MHHASQQVALLRMASRVVLAETMNDQSLWKQEGFTIFIWLCNQEICDFDLIMR